MIIFGEAWPRSLAPLCHHVATVRDCQAVQLVAHVAATHTGAATALVVGDFNETPGSFVYDQFVAQGWNDAYLAAGNPECVPATGVGCTSGRIDDALQSAVWLERRARIWGTNHASDDGHAVLRVAVLPTDVAAMLDRAPITKGAEVDRHGRPALGTGLQGRTRWEAPTPLTVATRPRCSNPARRPRPRSG